MYCIAVTCRQNSHHRETVDRLYQFATGRTPHEHLMSFWAAVCDCVRKKPHQSILTRREVRKAMHMFPLSTGIYKYLILSLLQLFLRHNLEKQKRCSHFRTLAIYPLATAGNLLLKLVTIHVVTHPQVHTTCEIFINWLF